MAYVIIGATGDLGRALAGLLAAKGHGLILVARGTDALEALADSIAGDGHQRPAVVAADVTEGPAYLTAVREAARNQGGIEALLLPIGRAIRDDLDTPVVEISGLVAINLTAAMDAVSTLWDDLKAAPRPVIVGFGSITAIRGGGRNLAYGAAKRALGAYFESLEILGATAGIAVQFYVLGFMDTAKMAHEATALHKGDVAHLAHEVVDRLGQGSFKRWYPWWWRALAVALRLLPQSLYRRIAAARSG
jgi:short-subunit dehydrogenase